MKALEAGGDPNFVQPPNQNHPSKKQSSTLERAISCGRSDVVELLLDHGANLPTDPDLQYDLFYLSRCSGEPKLLDILIRRGIHPHRDDADWALEHSHNDLYTQIASLSGDYQLSYDVDQLLASDDFFYDLFNVLPSYHSFHDSILYEPERVLRDLWEYQFSIGNGFNALVMNEK